MRILTRNSLTAIAVAIATTACSGPTNHPADANTPKTAASAPPAAQEAAKPLLSVEGDWGGTLSVDGIDMDLVFHVRATTEGYTATMDSPDQGAFDIPTDECTYENGVLTIEQEQSGLRFAGSLKDGQVVGTFAQSGMEIPLALTKSDTAKAAPTTTRQPGFQEVMQAMTTTDIEDRTYTQEEVAADVDFYLTTMEQACPLPYVNTKREHVLAVAEAIKSKGPRSARAVILDFNRLAASFKTGHIYIFSPDKFIAQQLDNGAKLFPLKLKKHGASWVVSDSATAATDQFKGKIVHTINGVDVAQFVSSNAACVHQPGESAEHVVGHQIPSFLFLNEIEAPFTVRWSSQREDAINTTEIAGMHPRDARRNQPSSENTGGLSNYITFAVRDGNTAYLNLKSMALFDPAQTKEYFSFVENAFEQMKQKGCEHLVVDLRENGGGRGHFAAFVLPFLADKPFRQSAGGVRRVSQQFKEFLRLMPDAMLSEALAENGMPEYFDLENGTNVERFEDPEPLPDLENRFEGKVWCLIGPSTASAAMMMANAIEDYDLGTLVGEPTGGIPNELSDMLPAKTPNCGIAFGVPTVLFTRANGDASNTNPVIPDVHIKTTADHRKTGFDPVLDYVIKQAAK